MSNLSRQAALLSIADFSRFFIKTLIGIALARLLSPADLGSYRQLFLIFTTLSGLLLLGFPQSMQYFLPKAKSEAERIRLISRTLNVVSLLGISAATIIYFSRYQIAKSFNNLALAQLLPLFAVYPILIFITQIYSSITLGLKDPAQNARFMLIGVSLDFVLVLSVAFFTRDLQIIVWALIVSALLQWLYAMWKLKGMHNLQLRQNFVGFKEQLEYTIPLGLSLLVGVLSVQLDKLMISGFFSPQEFAVFSLGAMELPLVGVLTNSVNAILLPNMAGLSKAKLSELYSASVRKNAIIIFPLAAVFFLFAKEFITFIYGAQYLESALYFRIYLLVLPLRVATYGILFQASGKTHLVMWDAIIMLLLNAALNYILIQKMGMRGAAWATVIVSWLVLLVYLWQIKYPLDLNLLQLFPVHKLLKNLVVAVLPLPLVAYLAQNLSHSFVRMLLGGGLYFVMYLALATIFKVVLPADYQFAVSLLPKLAKEKK